MRTGMVEMDTARIERAKALLPRIEQELAALPNEGDIPTMNEQGRVYVRRMLLLRLLSEMLNVGSPLVEARRKLDDAEAWADTLRACQIEFEAALARLESLPWEQRRVSERQEEALRWSLRILQDGPEPGTDTMPTLLGSWLDAHGVRPIDGRLIAGRGGLRFVQARIETLAKERAEAEQRAESMLQAAEDHLAATV